MKFSSFYEFKKEQLPRQLYEEIWYVIRYSFSFFLFLFDLVSTKFLFPPFSLIGVVFLFHTFPYSHFPLFLYFFNFPLFTFPSAFYSFQSLLYIFSLFLYLNCFFINCGVKLQYRVILSYLVQEVSRCTQNHGDSDS